MAYVDFAIHQPLYEQFLTPNVFPLRLELILLACVFVYGLIVFRGRQLGRSVWLAAFAIYGAVSAWITMLSARYELWGNFFVALIIFLFCIGATYLCRLTVQNQISIEQNLNLRFYEHVFILLTAWGFWIFCSLCDALLVNRWFMLSNFANEIGAGLSLVIFIVAFTAAFYLYWQENQDSILKKFMMPLGISFFITATSFVLYQYGFIFAYYALVFGKQQEITLVVKAMQRDGSRKSLCRYAVTYAATIDPLNQSKCVSQVEYSKRRLDQEIKVNAWVTPLGALVNRSQP